MHHLTVFVFLRFAVGFAMTANGFESKKSYNKRQVIRHILKQLYTHKQSFVEANFIVATVGYDTIITGQCHQASSSRTMTLSTSTTHMNRYRAIKSGLSNFPTAYSAHKIPCDIVTITNN